MRGNVRRSAGLALGLFIFLWACDDAPVEPEVKTPPAVEEQDELNLCEPGPSPLRRMTRREYNNTVRDLLAVSARPADDFPEEEEALGFNNNAEAQSTSQVLVEKYLESAEKLAAEVTKNPTALTGCDAAIEGEAGCAERLIRDLGHRAFRRPLEADDITFFQTFFTDARSRVPYADALGMVVEVMLQSPEFLYRLEAGTPSDERPGVQKLTDYEIASRLSYFLWGSLPDEALLRAAAAGELSTVEGIEAQARRMVQDPRAKETVRDFHGQWLQLARIEEIAKDAHVFPEFDPDIRHWLRAEADALIDDVVWNGSGDLKTLLSAPWTFRNGPLSKHYGVNGPTGDALQRVDLPAGQGAGLLTQGGLLSVLAKPNQTSPVRRGKFIREQLLCWMVPPPPDDVDITAPEPDANGTTRERFAQHREDPSCAGCHVLMDPIGFGFENFDALGRFRTTENNLPIDSSGEVVGTEIGTFNGANELTEKLADSEQVQQCVTRQWFRFAHGRADQKADQCTIDQLASAFKDSGLQIRELMVALTLTDAFRYRAAPAVDGGEK